MISAKLNKNNIAERAGNITVFNYDSETREYISSCNEYLIVGVGIPANSCTDEPEDKKKGYTVCRTSDLLAWEIVPDHRGEVVYSTESGEAMTINELGNYPENTTRAAPTTPFDVWNSNRWVTDTRAQIAAEIASARQQKDSLLAGAQVAINLWQTELQLGIISENDKASLINWLTYIKSLQSVDTSTAPKIAWPIQPEIVAS